MMLGFHNIILNIKTINVNSFYLYTLFQIVVPATIKHDPRFCAIPSHLLFCQVGIHTLHDSTKWSPVRSMVLSYKFFQRLHVACGPSLPRDHLGFAAIRSELYLQEERESHTRGTETHTHTHTHTHTTKGRLIETPREGNDICIRSFHIYLLISFFFQRNRSKRNRRKRRIFFCFVCVCVCVCV